jgi:hypothetical protein
VLVLYAALLMIASIVTAAATSIVMFDAGRIVQGLCTSLLLISPIPPLAFGYPIGKLKTTAAVSATALTATVMSDLYSPLHLGLLYLPELGGVVITAVVLGNVITKRSLSYLPLVGMGFLGAGILVFRIEVPSSEGLTLAASFLTGIGLGATVAPALFVAGFSLRAASLQRVLAIVELLRSVAAFMIAPIFAHFAANAAGGGLGLALAADMRLASEEARFNAAFVRIGLWRATSASPGRSVVGAARRSRAWTEMASDPRSGRIAGSPARPSLPMTAPISPPTRSSRPPSNSRPAARPSPSASGNQRTSASSRWKGGGCTRPPQTRFGRWPKRPPPAASCWPSRPGSGPAA